MLTHRLPPWALLILGLIPIALLLVLGDPLPQLVVLILAPITMVWAAVMTTLHWKRLDEAARAAHRWAWYWGGSIGLAIATVLAALMLVSPGLAASVASLTSFMVRPNHTPEQIYLFMGVIMTGVAQGAGFLGAWIYWWAAKR